MKENMFTTTRRSVCASADGIHERRSVVESIAAPEKPPEYHTTWYHAMKIVDILIDYKKSIIILIASINLGVFMSWW